ncbi:intracellular proteinase inhibitor [Robertmurraya sp. DFI.2.37]|jgi:hypothetical protein|uniref:intracellular proteinase inhibitor n=1 Tax=Robertmurraya sp. DFI.2.37 TaxID=3031819 RepID=UPI001245D7AC|nr:intracellular proteinase inhibitor [Robertmurraya sp. DFI.2.37]MDF1507402.1 intracellular proteinase inhibitor [Robertmurraya sp. DFI.2.37]
MLKQFTLLFLIPIFVNLFFGNVQQEEEKLIFQNVQVEGELGEYRVKGKVSANTGKLFYTVEDGHYQYIDEKVLPLAEKDSSMALFELEIKIAKEKLPQNATLILHLYEKDEDGRIIHSKPVVLEQI